MPAFPKLSPQGICCEFLFEFDLSVAHFAVLQSELSRWTVERILAGQRNCSREEGATLVRLVEDLRELQSSFPVRLDYRDSAAIRTLLHVRRQQAVQQEVQQAVRENDLIKQQLVEELAK